MTRTPGARKNPYTVMASRALAVVGAVMLARIVLLTREDGVPVLMVGTAGRKSRWISSALDLVGRRFEVVPLTDVTAFIRDQRYIPKRGVGLVVKVDDAAGLGEVGSALNAHEPSGGLPVTLLLSEKAAEALAAGGVGVDLPEGTAFGLEIGGHGVKARGEGWEGSDAARRLDTAIEALREGGVAVSYGMMEGGEGASLRRTAGAGAVEAFFGGDGLNRYGDRGNLIRLMDSSDMLTGTRAGATRLSACVAMYRGNYAPYPVWALLDLAAPMPADRGGGLE
jgi:hypothetical protein